MEKIREALKRFQEVVESLECECDSYHGYVCTVHSDRILAKAALIELDAILTSAMHSDGDSRCDCPHYYNSDRCGYFERGLCKHPRR